jgi:hypothetical protein
MFEFTILGNVCVCRRYTQSDINWAAVPQSERQLPVNSLLFFLSEICRLILPRLRQMSSFNWRGWMLFAHWGNSRESLCDTYQDARKLHLIYRIYYVSAHNFNPFCAEIEREKYSADMFALQNFSLSSSSLWRPHKSMRMCVFIEIQMTHYTHIRNVFNLIKPSAYEAHTRTLSMCLYELRSNIIAPSFFFSA